MQAPELQVIPVMWTSYVVHRKLQKSWLDDIKWYLLSSILWLTGLLLVVN